MKVLVTGATGFIGNYVIEELLEKNIEVIATSTNINKAKTFDWFKKVNYFPFVFSNKIEINLFEYFNKPNALIHLAWQGLPNYKADFHLTENLPQQKLFLSNLIENGLRNITVTGTCFEYGMQEGELSEAMICIPDNAYAQAKHELNLFLQELCLTKPLLSKWVRLFYMYGKGQNPKSLISQLDAAIENNESLFNMSGGEQVRDFLRVEEVAKNIVTIALQNKFVGVINCCSGYPITVKQFVENYLKATNRKINLNLGYYPYPDFEPFAFWGNNTKLNKILNEAY